MRVVAFTSDKGGMGKSTAAVNLACAATEEGLEVAVLDLDPQASIGRWSRIRKKAELPPRPVAETCVPIDIEDRLSELRDAGADLVILDTAGRDNNAIMAAIAAADMVLIPCHPTDLELSTLGPTFARLRASQTPHFVLLIDWSAGASRRRSDAAAAIERAGGSVAPVCYTHRSDYRLALESGKGVTEYQPFEPAANEIRSVWTWLRDELAIAKTAPDSHAAVA
jgi:chromosome partitioning protein